MAVNVFSASVPIDAARAGLDRVRADHEVVLGFPDAVLVEAEDAIAAYVLPSKDLTELGFVTLDPASSTDLDQAFFITRAGAGFRVLYAIADVPAFVAMGMEIDAETRRRGETVYCPDLTVSLHPPALADDAVSLLPDQLRGAYVWSFEVDAAGVARFTGLERATIRSRAKLGYEQEQQRLDEGSPHPQVALLREVGTRRQQQELARGAVSLPNLEQQVGAREDGFTLEYRVSVPVEDWNAQLSLMTGMAAARIMLDGGIGILRTMPEPAPDDQRRVRASARALGIRWPEEMAYPELIRALDATNPQHAAFLDNVTLLLRGAGYTAFDGERPALTTHSAIAAEYAHTTAPLRRLVDRFVLSVCLALVEGRAVDPAIREALPLVPDLMTAAIRRARAVDRESLDFLEAALLAGREGVAFRGVVIEQRREDGIVQLADPAITARCRGKELPVGEWVDVWLSVANPETREVVFEVTPRSRRS